MSREKAVTLPSLRRLLIEMGENIRLARLRRKFSATVVAERAGIARNTLRAIERGEPSVTLGAYANVLFCLGLEHDLKIIARDDVLGRKLQDVGLSIKTRAPRLKRGNNRNKDASHE
jgi:transcriptional regulator with XRE-family HTH domain